VRSADRIYVLADEAAVESGTHEALTAAGGHYAKLSSRPRPTATGRGRARLGRHGLPLNRRRPERAEDGRRSCRAVRLSSCAVEPPVTLPDDQHIIDPEVRDWVERTRRAAADGTLLADSFGRDEMRQYIVEESRRLGQ